MEGCVRSVEEEGKITDGLSLYSARHEKTENLKLTEEDDGRVLPADDEEEVMWLMRTFLR